MSAAGAQSKRGRRPHHPRQDLGNINNITKKPSSSLETEELREKLETVAKHIVSNPESLTQNHAFAPLRFLMSDVVRNPTKYNLSVEIELLEEEDSVERPKKRQRNTSSTQAQEARTASGVGNKDVPSGEATAKKSESESMLNIPLAQALLAQKTAEEESGTITAREQNAMNAWRKHVHDLIQHYQEHGDCTKLPQRNCRLGTWCSSQRTQRNYLKQGKKSSFTEYKQKILDAVGFVWEPIVQSWDERLEELKQFKQKHGHVNVSTNQKAHRSLGTWVRFQRKERRALDQGKNSNMTPYRLQALVDLGFTWDFPPPPTWDERLEELQVFAHEHGHCNVPRKYESLPGLGLWVKRMRREKKDKDQGKKTSLTLERMQKLEALGFAWTIYSKYERSANTRGSPNNDDDDDEASDSDDAAMEN